MDEINFIRNGNWQDFEFIPTKEFLLIQGHLGIPMSQMNSLYTNTLTEFKKNPLDKSLLYILVMIHPNHYHYVNHWKRLLIKDPKDIKKDDEFLNKLLHKYPKNSILWSHRKWINLTFHLSWDMFEQEKAADASFCNYSAWTFRLEYFSFIIKGHSELHLQEWKRVQEWIRLHPNDHSGLHYLWFLYEQSNGIFICKEDVVSFLKSLSILYPSHEALEMILLEFTK